MKDSFIKNFSYSNQSILKNEKNFAKSIVIRYKMANTKNKDFVNIILLNIEEIKLYYNLNLLIEELKKLNFDCLQTNNLKDRKLIAVVKQDETRELRINKIFTVSQFFF